MNGIVGLWRFTHQLKAAGYYVVKAFAVPANCLRGTKENYQKSVFLRVVLEVDPGVASPVHRLEGSFESDEGSQAQAQEIAVPRGFVHVVP
jgi:hypothetical protein